MPWLSPNKLAKLSNIRQTFCISSEQTTYNIASLGGCTSEDEDGLRAATAAAVFQGCPCIQCLATDPTVVRIVRRWKSKGQSGEDRNRKELHFGQLVEF